MRVIGRMSPGELAAIVRLGDEACQTLPAGIERFSDPASFQNVCTSDAASNPSCLSDAMTSRRGITTATVKLKCKTWRRKLRTLKLVFRKLPQTMKFRLGVSRLGLEHG